LVLNFHFKNTNFKIFKKEKNNFRSCILIRLKIGITAIEIFNELRLASPENYPSYVTVYGLAEGTEDLKDLL
jgi:hypothetical protein